MNTLCFAVAEAKDSTNIPETSVRFESRALNRDPYLVPYQLPTQKEKKDVQKWLYNSGLSYDSHSLLNNFYEASMGISQPLNEDVQMNFIAGPTMRFGLQFK